MLADAPLLYWNFDEVEGDALQQMPVPLPLPNNANNELVAQAGVVRVLHEGLGTGFQLGNAIELSGANCFQAADLDVAISSVAALWAVEFWMKKTTRARKRNTIGDRVRQARLRAKPPISQDDLAGKLAAQGVLLDRSAISRIENQDHYVVDYEAVALARCLKVSVAWLCGERAD